MNEKIKGYVKANYKEIIIISIITVTALLLRLICLKNYGDLWLDELYSWYFADNKNVFATLWKLIKQDLHMPIYFLILHFWIKIFGQSDLSMHLCSIALTLPLIPLSFYLVKNLFNKRAGYFAAILFAISSFCIYYSVEVRFYGLVFVLTLISAFYFVKMFENFDKKQVTGFIVSQALLIYTFTITPLLTFFYWLTGFYYLNKNQKERLKDFNHAFFIIGLTAIPAVIFTLYNIIVMKVTDLCSFAKDVYIFKWSVITDILENYFSGENFQIVTGAVNLYRNMFANITHIDYYLLWVIVPVLIGLAGLLKAFMSKEKKLYLFVIPSVLFLICALFLGAFGLISFMTKYTAIIYPIVICVACYGLTLFDYKLSGVILFALLVLLNLTYPFVSKQNIYELKRKNLGNLTQVMSEVVKPDTDDLILIPYSGSKVMRYVPQGKFIDFCADDALLLKDGHSQAFYFDEKFYKTLNRKNIKDYMQDDIIRDAPFVLYLIRLNDFYFKKMKKGQKFIIITYRDEFLAPLINNWSLLKNGDFYDNVNMFLFLMSKITRDSIQLANMYLKPVNKYVDSERGYTIFVYEKQ